MTTRERSKRLREANADALAEAQGKKGYDKRVTTFKGETASKDSSGDTGGTGAVDFAPMAPTEEQLAKINEYTRSNKTADDLVVFPTLSCNDLLDRDEERFVTDTVKGFANLEPPYGPNGKSYMVGHDYTKLPVGRIFDTSVATLNLSSLANKGATAADSSIDVASKATFLKNWVYVPKTDANRQFIENLDYGINWAVSVGVMLEEAKCALPWCGAPMMTSRFFGAWCQEGHDKGYYYTEDAERDDWGYYDPCDPKTPGAVKCTTDLYGAKDFYELSQVFLGAQFFAALDGTKGATAKGILKAASARSIPVVGLSRDEAALIEEAMPHLPTKVVEAVRTLGIKPDEEGAFKWTGKDGLVWTFNPTEDSEVMCLGKATDSGEEGTDGQAAQEQPDGEPHGSDSGEQPPSASASADDGEGDGAEDGRVGTGEEPEGDGQDGGVDGKSAANKDSGGHTHSHTHADTSTTHSHSHTHSAGNGYQHTTSDNVTHSHGHSGDTDSDGDTGSSDTDNDGKEAAVSKKAVLTALRSLSAPDAVLRAVEDADGESLDTALRPLVGKITTLTSEVATLTPKAALGDTFIEAKRAEALDWFVKANQTEPNSPVGTDVFERLLTAAGDNVDLIDALIEQQKSLAQAKFPAAVRRSSFPTDANKSEPGEVPSLPDNGGVDNATGRTVKRIHG